MTTLYVDNIAPNLQSKISAPNLTLPSGSVVQVAYTSIDSNQSLSSAQTWTDISNASVSFTPKYANSTLLIDAISHIFVDGDSGGWETVATRIVADGTAQSVVASGNSIYGFAIRVADSTDYRAMGYDVKSWEYDVSSTNAITIKVQMYADSIVGVAGINKYGVGSLRIMEIAG